MQSFTLIPGAVYQVKWDERPHRVLAFDQYEVFYDCYWPLIDKWTIGSQRSNGYYFRMTPKRFLEEAKLLREQPLTEKELAMFRPDLPFRLCRNKSVTWTAQQFPDMQAYLASLNGAGRMNDDIILPVPVISLHPFGPKGGAVKSTLITANDSRGFTGTELLWHAQNLQSVHLREEQQPGVGIYRLGHEKKVPAYYIGGYYDLAGFIPKES